MKRWLSARSLRGRIEQRIGPVRKAPNPELGSQLEDLRIHVLRCERWAQLDDRLDLAVRTGRTRL